MSRHHQEPARLTELGRVSKAHGLKGELCIELYADSPFLFADLRRIYLRLPGQNPKPCAVEAWRPHQGRALVLLDRCQGRDEAELWRGAEVLARTRDLPRADEDAVRIEDLLGLLVEDMQGCVLGRVTDVRDIAGQEIWFFCDSRDNEIMLPAVFVQNIDLESGRVAVDPPDGLLELYQKS